MTSSDVEAELKQLRKDEGNKKCFLCAERGPSYIDMDHLTFVCTGCGGILREFTFKIKGISMATFTSQEVKALKTTGGNLQSREIYFARYKNAFPDQSDKEAIRQLIRDAFVNKKYMNKKSSSSSKQESSGEEGSDDEEEKNKRKAAAAAAAKKKKAAAAVATKKKKEESSEESGESSEEEQQNPKKKSAAGASTKAAPKAITSSKATPKPSENLLDMDFGFGESTTTTSKPAKQTHDDSFDDFVSAGAPPAAPAKSGSSDPFDFGDFASAMPSKPVQPAFGSFSGMMPASTTANVAPDIFQSFSSAPALSDFQPNNFGFSMAPAQQTQPVPQQQMYGQQQWNMSAHPVQMSSQQQQPMMMAPWQQALQQQQQQQQSMLSMSFPTTMHGSNNPFLAAKASNQPVKPLAEDIFGSFT